MTSSDTVDYGAAVNRAIDHVLQHLEEPLRLEDVARAAAFSPFHFHRVFQSLVGETPGQFVKRMRLERALTMMAHGGDRALTEVALACGFSSSSDFSRSFKQRYGVPPSAFDVKVWRASKREELRAATECSPHLERLPPGENPDGFEVELRDLPARSVAYLRVHDPYQGDGVREAVERLVAWAEPRGLADNQWLGYQWDDPEIVALADCRYDIAVEFDPRELDPVGPDAEVGRFEFPAMRVAHVRISGGVDLELRALDWLYGTWLPTSGCVPDDQPCFEAFRGRPFEHGTEHFELHAQLPVRRGTGTASAR
jgi:AraC family transcriptional regulator